MPAATPKHLATEPAHRNREAIDFYLDEIGRTEVLSESEEHELALRARDGDEAAADELVARNLRFVVSIAKQYQHRGLALDDLIAEGNVGLLAAARRFDPDRGVRFITYAVWWVRQAILVALTRQVRLVRVPVSRLADGARSEFPSYHLSLDAALSDPDARLLGERIALEAEGDEPGESDDVRELLAAALASLHPREAEIVRNYFGLEGHSPHTLDEVASEMHVTRERVRQIRDRAIGKLRFGKYAAALFALTR